MHKTRNERKRDLIRIVASLLAGFAATCVCAAILLAAYNNKPSEEEEILAAQEAWFETAEEDYMEDPLESEHIETAIYELSNKRYALTDEELYLVCGIVAAEAENEPYPGKMAVAQTILNHCERENARPADVAWKYAERRHTWSEEVWLAVTAVFFEGRTATEEKILWFYAPAYGYSQFHESQRFVVEIGGHRFFAAHEEVTP